MTPDFLILFDLVLAAGILWIAWVSLASTDAVRMVVAFMAFGILVALAWVRLNAPDVALAEAAVGAGVTGALFLRTIGMLNRDEAPEITSAAVKVTAALTAIGVTAALAAAIVMLPRSGAGYDALVAADLDRSGVKNPVTAVLLNFRAFDTLLEIVVLLAALVAAILIGARQTYRIESLGPLLPPFARLVVPLSILIAAFLLWLGTSRPGGAFQAGSVLAGGLSVLLMGRLYRPRPSQATALRWLANVGLIVFAGASVATLALSGGLIAFPAEQAIVWIVAIEAALTVSIGVLLAALFHGGLPKGSTS
jgi:multisubunit Na+/H+ antiporter MnhB subunit